MLNSNCYFIDLILPFSIKDFFTYHLNENTFKKIEIGMRVAVPFRGNKLYTGIVIKKYKKSPEIYKTRSIYQILDKYPIVTLKQLKLWKWIANYYFCSLGQVYKIAIPDIFKLKSQTIISKNKETIIENINFSRKEQLIWNALEKLNSISIKKISKFINSKNILSILRKMLDKSLIQINERLIYKYKIKKKYYIFIHPDFKEKQDKWSKIFFCLKNSPKQKKALMFFISHRSKKNNLISQKEFLKKSGVSRNILYSLFKKKILCNKNLNIDNIIHQDTFIPSTELPKLTLAQKKAYQEINQCFKIKDTVVLNGVMASGKTEIYIQFIQKTINQGKSVLYLLPEIALTTHLVVRLKKYFGSYMILYHSKLHQNERAEIWKKVLQKTYSFIIGARSALFLPLSSLGLIIIDEEHESAFKQKEILPYYHARDTALILAKIQGAKSILGSATPSLETFYNSKIGKYSWVNLKERYSTSNIPFIKLIDLKKRYYNKCMFGLFSKDLLLAIDQTVKDKKQFLLFQNRRGYSPIVQCNICGFIPKCFYCDVSLTYHFSKQILLCHYCGYSQKYIYYCSICENKTIDYKGFGTQKIENQLKKFLPNLRISRMDTDTMSKKLDYEKLINNFQKKKIDGIIGTQMIVKGLDFEEVTLVGVICADQLLSYPNFRSEERSYQILSQLSGRSGRRELTGRVFIQTFQKNHFVLKKVLKQEYESICIKILKERKKFFYPPYSKLIEITMSHSDMNKISIASNKLSELLRIYFGSYLFGPEAPIIGRIKSKYLQKILIKIFPEKKYLNQARNYIHKTIKNFYTIKKWQSIFISINVDPF